MSRRRLAALGGLLVMVALGLTAPVLDHPFDLDDDSYIVFNRAVVDGVPLSSYFLDGRTNASRPYLALQSYRPVRTLALRAVARIGGVTPRAFGVANRALYGLSIALVLLLALRVTGRPWPALGGAALWAFAPVHVEPVVYASALGDHLSLLLELCALACGALVIGGGNIDGDPRAATEGAGRRRWLVAAAALSLLLAALAMGTKETAITLGGLLAAWAARRGLPGLFVPRTLALLVAHALLAAGFLWLHAHIRGGSLGHAETTATTLAHGLLQAPVLLVEYLRICVAPLGHHPAYVAPAATGLRVAASLFVVAIGAFAALRARTPGLRFGMVWFAVTLLPVLQLVPIAADLADRFALLPSIGLAVAAAAGLSLLPPRIAGVAAAAVALLFAAGTVAEQRNWSDPESLWEHAVEMEPRSPQACVNLGGVRMAQRRTALALDLFDRALAQGGRGPDYELPRASALAALGQVEEAEAALAALLAREPGLGRAHALRGDLALRRRRIDLAGVALAAGRAVAPDEPSLVMLAAVLAQAQHDPAAEAQALARLVLLTPRDARLRYLQGRAALAAGDRDAGLSAGRACLGLDPAAPQCQLLLGLALVAQGTFTDEARTLLDHAALGLPPGPDRSAAEEARRRWP
ncbi:MAG: hypothetical protein EXR72_19755 [Myxococcales bacterium]|nr:hypothetical protein [Myxococcales bacterium]